MAASPRAATAPTAPEALSEPATDDGVRALIALAALGGPDRLSHDERLALGRALETSPALRAELRALAAVRAALPPASPPGPLDHLRAAIPPGLLRVEVVAALAAAILLLGVARIASVSSGVPGTVPAATAAAVDATLDVVDRPWGVDVRVVVSGTDPDRRYEVTVTDATGASVPLGGFAGDAGEIRFAGTAPTRRADVRQVQVADDAGAVIVRADLD